MNQNQLTTLYYNQQNKCAIVHGILKNSKNYTVIYAATDRQIRAAKPSEKKQKLNDGNGLYLEITPKGNKVFRFDFAIHGKRQTLTYGKYPAVSINEARAMHTHS
ncbi:Arm DNA-binding domain-containing protein [Neisseriaceae bacterium B1]